MSDAAKGLVGAFDAPGDMVRALERLRALGLHDLDACSPFPVLEAEEALGLRRRHVPQWALLFGALGGGGIYYLQWWINVVDYPLDVGGRPLHAAPAFIPWTFELTVLSASIATMVAWLVVSRLPQLWHPLFEVEGFERASLDRFFVTVGAADPAWDEARVTEVLRAAGAVDVRPM